MQECFLVCHTLTPRRNTELIVLRREGQGVTTNIAGMTGSGLKEDDLNAKKEEGYGVRRKDVGGMTSSVIATSIVMTEDTKM